MENLIGKTIDNYKIISVLGKGGMGVVYEAYDTKLERKVAIKVMSSQLFNRSSFIERFKREAKNQAKLIHQNVVTVYGFMEYGDMLGIVMEFVEGESLEKVIYRQKRLHLYDVIYIMKQVLAGIGYAHSKGFIHRDIKPSNIVFNKEGSAKIMDFGISKSLFEKGVTQTGAKVGTVYYMSPEQIKGIDITHRSDVYSLGCTMYEMLVGKPPFYGENDYDIMDAHLKKEPPKISEMIPGTPKIIDDIITKSMNKDPEKRYVHCSEFQSALREVDNYISNISTTAAKKKENNKKRVKTNSTIGFMVFLAVVISLSWFVYNQVDEIIKSEETMDAFKRYSFQSLFESDETSFSRMAKQISGTNRALNGITLSAVGQGIAVGDSGTVLLTENAGELWYDVELDGKYKINDALLLDDGKCFLVGGESSFVYSDDFMKTIQKFPVDADHNLFKVRFIDNNLGFVLGSKGMVMRTTNGGSDWSRISMNTSNILYDVAFVDQNLGYIVGWNGMYLKTTNGGSSWREEEPFTNRYLKSIDFYEDIGIAVGGNLIFRTDDGGETWIQVMNSPADGFQTIKFINDELVLIAGGKGILMVSQDEGETWNAFDTKTLINFSDLELSSDGSVYLTGVNGTILKIM
ncbi:MAG: protein kinase [Melioribacteraceae bacterium]|nr:protein kinase [Melioribacteraceae bacterium]